MQAISATSFFIATAQDQGDESVFLFNVALPNAGSHQLLQDLRLVRRRPSTPWDGLPDASKGDTQLFLSPHPTWPCPTAATAPSPRSSPKSTTFTVPAGGGNTVSIAQQAAPLSSSISTNAKLSQFAALVPSMNPAARLTEESGLLDHFPSAGASLFGIPGSLSYPDFPRPQTSSAAWRPYDYFGSLSTDTNCGTIAYGGFLDAPYQSMRNFVYQARRSSSRRTEAQSA